MPAWHPPIGDSGPTFTRGMSDNGSIKLEIAAPILFLFLRDYAPVQGHPVLKTISRGK